MLNQVQHDKVWYSIDFGTASVSLIYIQKGVRKMDIQEIKKEKQKIEENFRKILIEFEEKIGFVVENIDIKRVSEAGRNSKLLSLELGLKLK